MNYFNHYLELKKDYKDALVFYRIGDFYELFGQDAITASEILSLTLTSRDCGFTERIPMCGVPYHAVDNYIAKLIKCGYKTAICEPTTKQDKTTEQDTNHQSDNRLNLTATGTEQTILKNYLEKNASDVLIDKINNGIRIEKDGKTLISKKTLETFLKYACDEAQKQAEKGTKAACIKSDTVFGWAIHYFEEDSIDGTLYNEDGTEYKPAKVVSKNKATVATNATKAASPTPKSKEFSLFDLMDNADKPKDKTEQITIDEDEPEETEIDDAEMLDAIEQQRLEMEDALEPDEPQEKANNCYVGFRQINETEYIDADGVLYKTNTATKTTIPEVLTKLFGEILIAR